MGPPRTRARAREERLHLAVSVALALGVAAAFYAPALQATHGEWPAPLDDVFIHYDFARSAAQGHPFEWIAGQGFSSGETAPLYAFVLAAGYLVGFRGLWLGLFAGGIAVASLVSMMRGVRRLMRGGAEGERAGTAAERAAAWIGPALIVSVGVLDWSWFSGMETALFGALAVRALVAGQGAMRASPTARARAQWIAGAWCAALVLVRPEAAVVTFALSVAIARRAGSQSALAALARSALPAATATCAVLGANRLLSGDAASAGAALKLLSSNPYLSDFDRAREFAENLAFARWKVLEAGLSAVPGMWVLLPLLAASGLLARRTRALSAVCLASSLGWTVLVCFNGAARFQNFRYFAPALALLVTGSALGLSALARLRRGSWVGSAVACAAAAVAAPRVASQIALFRDASRNIHDQQVEVGKRLSRVMPPGASVLIGDAGAIAYVSARHAIDALGLGGYRRLPFVRAAVLGEAATVELLEHLPTRERPSYLALYPNWFGGITSAFGREIGRVTIEHNVICGGPTKVVYEADWSALSTDDDVAAESAGDGERDVLDTADVVSEEAHAYASPAPFGGWTRMDVRRDEQGRRRFDAGRVTPAGQSERFVATHDVRGPAALVVRTDDEPCDAEVTVEGEGPFALEEDGRPRSSASAGAAWSSRRAILPSGVRAGQTIALRVLGGALHDYHVWIGRTDARAGND